MNIRNNIANYLFDKDYLICIYENYVYVLNYTYLESFNSKSITLKIKEKYIAINGQNLTIVKITKEEILIKGKLECVGIQNE